MAHTHPIPVIKLPDSFNRNILSPVNEQFFHEFEMENKNYYCFNNNLPDSETEYYHLFDMTIYSNQIFTNQKFVFFIPKENDRLIIDSENSVANFKMGNDKNSIEIMHPRETTCNPLLFILKDYQNIAPFKYSIEENILVPMFGFYDGNSQRLPNRLQQHDVYGYFYKCDNQQFEAYVVAYGDQKKEVDFYNDPLINGKGGYYYNTKIDFNEY